MELGNEITWLFAALLLCAMMIFGCACCSLRITRIQQRRQMEMDEANGLDHGFRAKNSSSFNGGIGADSFGGASFGGPDISCEFDNSIDQTSSSIR